MEIEFEKEYLKELYEEGKTSSKKHRFQPQIIKQYKKALDYLKFAIKIEDLYLIRSLHYEELIGNKKGLESVRVNNQYRIEFKSRIESNELQTITISSIVELSNHYS